MSKLLGYKLKEDCEEYRESAFNIAGMQGYERHKHMIDDFNANCIAHERLQLAGVMHWFEEVYEEEKLEVGKWYKNDYDQSLVYLLDFDKPRLFGFSGSGKWLYEQNNSSFRFKDEFCKWSEATNKEVEEALINEAKKRGFKDGVKFKPLNRDLMGGHPESVNFESFLDYDSAGLWARCGDWNGVIFQNGEWAKIIPDAPLNGKTAIIDGVEYILKIK